jgi:hypothetical protein
MGTMGISATLSYAARRVLRLPQIPVARAASRSWVVHPAVREVRPRAFFLDGQLDRVEGVQNETSLDFELARVLGREVEHAATMAFELDDATIFEGSVYAGGTRLRFMEAPFSLRAFGGAEEELDRAALDCTFVGNRYFGHWIADDCPLHLLAREHAEPIGVTRPLFGQEAQFGALWGLHPRKVSSATVRKLLYFLDYSQNRTKRERYERLRAPIQARAGSASRRGVYFRRGSGGALRELTNQTEIEERLTRRGFHVLDPTVETVEKVMDLCAGAPCVVSVEGSQLAHGLLNVAAGGSLLALQPPNRFNNVYKDRADCLGLRYGFVVGRGNEAGFHVDVDEIERTLDLCGIA